MPIEKYKKEAIQSLTILFKRVQESNFELKFEYDPADRLIKPSKLTNEQKLMKTPLIEQHASDIIENLIKHIKENELSQVYQKINILYNKIQELEKKLNEKE